MKRKPRLSLIINTACMDYKARRPWAYHDHANYSNRADLLRETLRTASGFYEIIVVGSFEPGPGYTYIEKPPTVRSRMEALAQRELGARYSTGDILIFCHDDHRPSPTFASDLLSTLDAGDIIVPKRLSLGGEELNNGKDDDYMGGHCFAMHRWVWASIPWTSVETEWWDLVMTGLWRNAGAKIAWVDRPHCIDLET